MTQEWDQANPEKRRSINRRYWQRKSGLFLTFEEEQAIYAKSDGLCVICSEPAQVIDHDHETGQPRGALCRKCNQGIGLLGDDEEKLMKALDYLRSSRYVEV